MYICYLVSIKGDVGKPGEPGDSGPKGEKVRHSFTLIYSIHIMVYGQLNWCVGYFFQGDEGLQGMTGLEGPWGAVGERGERGTKGDKGNFGLMVRCSLYL